MISSGTPLSFATHSKSRRQAAAAPGATEYMRAFAMRAAMALLREDQLLTEAHAAGLLEHGVAQRDVGDAEAAVPEQDGLAVALAAGLLARDDPAELGVERLLREL